LVERSAPARVNLIGEHTDYTGGLVLPLAIPFYSFATITSRSDTSYRFVSENFEADRILERDDRSGKTGTWSDYPVGVLRQLQAKGIEPPPFTMHLLGDVPLGAGLSSSAAVEVATAMAFLAFVGRELPPEEIAVLCRRAENDFVGSPCGIMDQFAVIAAEAGHALLLNTRDLTFESLPMDHGRLANTRVVIANSTVNHSITDGDYGLRRREVEDGQAVLRTAFPELRDLGGATLEQLADCRPKMSIESHHRCRHIISENQRVRNAREAMLQGDPERLGQMMLESHFSQRDDFACSCDEIDFLVARAMELPGCYGSRLTGGGFGGCTVSLVAEEEADDFAAALTESYRKEFGLDAPVFLCKAVDGAMRRGARQKVRD
jgi:galactokinase